VINYYFYGDANNRLYATRYLILRFWSISQVYYVTKCMRN